MNTILLVLSAFVRFRALKDLPHWISSQKYLKFPMEELKHIVYPRRVCEKWKRYFFKTPYVIGSINSCVKKSDEAV